MGQASLQKRRLGRPQKYFTRAAALAGQNASMRRYRLRLKAAEEAKRAGHTIRKPSRELIIIFEQWPKDNGAVSIYIYTRAGYLLAAKTNRLYRK